MQHKIDNTERSNLAYVKPTVRSDQDAVQLTLVRNSGENSPSPSRRKLGKEEAVREAMQRTG